MRLLVYIKIRTYAKSEDELWRDEWHNPLEKRLPVTPEVIRDLKRRPGELRG